MTPTTADPAALRPVTLQVTVTGCGTADLIGALSQVITDLNDARTNAAGRVGAEVTYRFDLTDRHPRCRHCLRAIVAADDGRWSDETRDPFYCPKSLGFNHVPHTAADLSPQTQTQTQVPAPVSAPLSLGQATSAAALAEEREVQIALRDLCAAIRSDLPAATVVVLDDSDQGDWAVVYEVRDADGEDLAEDWDDPDDIAATLYGNRNYLWAPYLVQGTALDRRNPCRAEIVIDTVLADLA